jgi:death-on-curing protein
VTGRKYLTLVDVLVLHQSLISKFGGEDGILNLSGLESALARPKSGYYMTIQEEACAIFQSIWLNHPFVDGNKRVAIAAMDIFLRINGYKLSNRRFELQEIVLGLKDSTVRDFELLCKQMNPFIVKVSDT